MDAPVDRPASSLAFAGPMHLLFVTHYFHPEVGAPQTRILEAARLLRRRGHEVTVLTGFPNYPDGIIPEPYRGRILQTEDVEGIRVVRSWVLPAPNRGFARRIVNHTTSAVSAVLASPKVRRVDVVIGETPPLFTAAASVLIAKGHRAKLLLNVADLWPESAVQLGMLRNRHAIRAAELLERFAYRHSATITVPTAGMRRILIEQGHPADRVVHLPNAVDTDRFVPPSAPSERLTKVLYSGTVGLAQGVGTLLDAAGILAGDDAGLTVRVVGDGAEREDLQRSAAERGLANVAFSGRLPAIDIPGIIADADIAVMSLVDVPLFEDAVPTKLLEYMAAGKPVVAAAAGEAARVVERAGCGFACPPEDPPAMADALRRIAADPQAAFAMGQAGRRYAEEHVSRRAFVDRLEGLARAATGR